MLVGCKRDLRDDAEAKNDGSAEDERRFVSFKKVSGLAEGLDVRLDLIEISNS